MQKRLNMFSAAAISLAMALPAVAQDTTVDTVVATVNGTEITLGHMIVARATLPDQYQQLPDDVLFRGILDQLIQQAALSQTLTTEPPRRVDLSLENERRSLLAGEVVEGILAQEVTEEAVQAAYDERYAAADAGEEYNASHILVESEDEAKAIKEQLDGGGDFAELAKEKSTGPSGPNGGSLGWFGPGMMVPSFEAAVIALKPGEVSDPVETQFGWHIVTLVETRKKEAPSLEDTREEITQELQRGTVEEYINDVVEKADVDRAAAEGVDPALLKDLSLIE